ncbi:MAG TPA: lipoyl(octanoyl) transferase LipB [Armatimonadota bacterium]|nr:lipoyl(octanoyl) transferase LipB [Armatimonadota bacterium]
MSLPTMWVIRVGCVEYDQAVALQERVHLARQEGRVPDVLLLLEHPAVITLGRGAHAENLLADPAQLERRGVAVRESARGGDITYHGPGQLVGYPIFDLNGHGKDVHRYLRSVEEALILALARFGISGDRAPGLTGVWVGMEKVAAIGVGVRRWVTWHGFALNISTDLDAFSLIVPCGIRDRGVTSLNRLLHRPVPEAEVADAIIDGFREVFSLHPEERGLADLAL